MASRTSSCIASSSAGVAGGPRSRSRTRGPWWRRRRKRRWRDAPVLRCSRYSPRVVHGTSYWMSPWQLTMSARMVSLRGPMESPSPHDLQGDALADVALRPPILDEGLVRPAQHVHEARRHGQAGDVQLARPGRPVEVADGGDPVPRHGDVGDEGLAAAAVVDGAAAEDHVVGGGPGAGAPQNGGDGSHGEEGEAAAGAAGCPVMRRCHGVVPSDACRRRLICVAGAGAAQPGADGDLDPASVLDDACIGGDHDTRAGTGMTRRIGLGYRGLLPPPSACDSTGWRGCT